MYVHAVVLYYVQIIGVEPLKSDFPWASNVLGPHTLSFNSNYIPAVRFT